VNFNVFNFPKKYIKKVEFLPLLKKIARVSESGYPLLRIPI
jgi:hypothetical protein